MAQVQVVKLEVNLTEHQDHSPEWFYLSIQPLQKSKCHTLPHFRQKQYTMKFLQL